jgi:hypothetical protein
MGREVELICFEGSSGRSLGAREDRISRRRCQRFEACLRWAGRSEGVQWLRQR